MVGCSLRHRGEELLGQRGGLGTYVAERGTMGIPLLYPWANRLGRERFEVAGREVVLDSPSTPAERGPQRAADPRPARRGERLAGERHETSATGHCSPPASTSPPRTS